MPISTAHPVAGTADSLVRAAEAGIDVLGAIPGDHIRARDGALHAKAGTRVALWIRAQMDVSNAVEK